MRYITNRSSGKMGNALARAARDAGAAVFLVTAARVPIHIRDIRTVKVDTAAEMHARVRECLAPGAVLIMAAAVADYRAVEVSSGKLKKSESGVTLELEPTVDILATLASDLLRDELFVVGFAAETEDHVANGYAKLVAKRMDICVVNDVSSPGIGIGADDNAVTIVDRDGIVAEVPRAPKFEVAQRILEYVAARLPRVHAGATEGNEL